VTEEAHVVLTDPDASLEEQLAALEHWGPEDPAQDVTVAVGLTLGWPLTRDVNRQAGGTGSVKSVSPVRQASVSGSVNSDTPRRPGVGRRGVARR